MRWWISKAKPKPTRWMQLKQPLLYTIISTSILVGAVIIFAPEPRYKDGFASLTEISAYAKSKNEKIKPDTANTIKPVFDSYYNTLKPTWKTTIKKKLAWTFSLIGIHQTPPFSASFFKSQLEDLSKKRTEKGYTKNCIVKVATSPHGKFIIFGNVQGAFHSLVRNLNELKKLEIIDDSLTITSRDFYIIFMGDVVSRSPYTMETLSIVMKLMQKNPNNIIYLKGNHETANYWQEHTLKTELQIRGSHLSKETIPLAQEVNQFFNTLPLAAYLSTFPKDAHNFIRISDAGRTQSQLLLEDHYGKFLTEKSDESLSLLDLDNKGDQASSNNINVAVIFKGEKKRETFQPMKGLRFLSPDMGSVAWNILSCPTMVYQIAIKFFYDAFTVVKPAQTLDGWTITLHNRDARSNDPFSATTFYLLSGGEEGKAPQPAPTPMLQTQTAPATSEQPKPAQTNSSALAQIPKLEAKPTVEPKQVVEKKIAPQKQPESVVSAFSKPSVTEKETNIEPEKKESQHPAKEEIDSETTEELEKHADIIDKHIEEIKKIVSEIKEEEKTKKE